MALGRFHAIDLSGVGRSRADGARISRLACQPIMRRTTDQNRRTLGDLARGEIAAAKRIAATGLNAATVFADLAEMIDDDAVIAVDVGNNTYSFGRYFECQQQSVLMSGYLGSIGFSFPAAMGAWAAAGDKRQIVSVSGDGGFGQYGFEVTTAVKYKMNITHIMLHNGQLGKISKEQRSADMPVWQTSLHNPNFAEFATLCGAKGIRVTDPADLPAALREALDYPGPALVEIMTDPDLN